MASATNAASTIIVAICAAAILCPSLAAAEALNSLAAGSWIKIEAGHAFSFDAPVGTEAVPVRGIDSLVGRYVSGSFSVDFDYGAYSNPLDYRADPNFTTQNEIIDGKPAVIVAGPGEGGGDCKLFTGVYVIVRSKASSRIALSMTGCAADQSGIQTLHRLFRSIKFSNAGP